MEYIEIRRLPIDSELRGIILRRDKYSCRYCGSKREPFHLDHVYPVAKGGETSERNLVTACESCNQRKHAAVGVWPKPIGYFEKKPPRATEYVFLVLIAQILLYGGVSDYQSFSAIAEIQIVMAFVLVSVFLLPDTIKTHIELFRKIL